MISSHTVPYVKHKTGKEWSNRYLDEFPEDCIPKMPIKLHMEKKKKQNRLKTKS